jgi:aspartyl-tRNA synthetase
LTIDPHQFNFLWVIEFPLLGFDREQNRWYSSHHPFTAPVAKKDEKGNDIPGEYEGFVKLTGKDSITGGVTTDYMVSDHKKIKGQHYDVVVNGVELGGGSIRIHNQTLQKFIFESILQINPVEARLRFGYMLDAFRYGAPPHGGIALGFDRLIAILCGTPSIRDVIAFPKTAKGTDLMTNSPSTVSPRQLRDLYIEVKVAKKE